MGNFIETVDKEIKNLMEEFSLFATDCRVLVLIERSKDGGGNKEEQRVFQTRVSYDSEQFERALKELVILKRLSDKTLRIYVSVNSRSVGKTIRYIKHQLVDADYAAETERDLVHMKLLRNPRHFLMQPEHKASKLFMIDVDNEEGRDVMGEVLQRMEVCKVQEVGRFRTKNGWHVVIQPFNISEWNHSAQINRDGLLLMSY